MPIYFVAIDAKSTEPDRDCFHRWIARKRRRFRVSCGWPRYLVGRRHASSPPPSPVPLYLVQGDRVIDNGSVL